MLQWQKTYETGNRFIDAEHKLLFDLANEMGEVGFTHPLRFKEYFLDLIQYTTLHFASEEIVMREIGYQELQSHSLSHRAIVAEMKSLVMANHDLAALKREFEPFLQKWLVNHIVHEDMAWRPKFTEWKSARLKNA